MTDREIDGPRGPIAIRLYDPGTADSSPCLVYFHGGGFVIGSTASHEGVCRLDPADGFIRDLAAWMKQQSAELAESKTTGRQ